jgi:hypothetical protein
MDNLNHSVFPITESEFRASPDHSFFAIKKLRSGLYVVALFSLVCVVSVATMIYLHFGTVPGPLIIAAATLVAAVAKLQARAKNGF